jgi:hypothetical protein
MSCVLDMRDSSTVVTVMITFRAVRPLKQAIL